MNNTAMQDKDILNNSILLQKHMTSSYDTFAGECVDPQLRTAMLNVLNDEHRIQAEIFSTMQANGWYQVCPAQQQKIDQAKQKFAANCTAC